MVANIKWHRKQRRLENKRVELKSLHQDKSLPSTNIFLWDAVKTKRLILYIYCLNELVSLKSSPIHQ